MGDFKIATEHGMLKLGKPMGVFFAQIIDECEKGTMDYERHNYGGGCGGDRPDPATN